MQMKVIGAGLPRTATLSQKVALEMLGFGPCYHMVDVLADLTLVPPWVAALEGEPRWEQIFAGFQSTVDWPGGFFYRELLDAYPDAKVLLSVRDPQAWERSMRDTVWGVRHGDSLIAHLSGARALVDPQWEGYLAMIDGVLWKDRGVFAGPHHDRDWLIDAMQRHSEEVKRTVPAEKLLVWQVGDGWEPLCRFLEVDVPAAPFPHANDSSAFVDRVVSSSLEALQEWWARHALATV